MLMLFNDFCYPVNVVDCFLGLKNIRRLVPPDPMGSVSRIQKAPAWNAGGGGEKPEAGWASEFHHHLGQAGEVALVKEADAYIEQPGKGETARHED